MSKFNLIALAIAASLAAPSAMALTVTAGTPNVANVDIEDDATVAAVGKLDIAMAGTDLIIGRTVGFSVRIDLENGAEFDGISALPTVGAALPGGPLGWTVTKAAGGGAGETFVVYSVQPGTDSTGVINGVALSFAANSIEVANVEGLKATGAEVKAKVTFADPGTATAILTPVTQTILKSVNPLDYKVAAIPAFANARVDVGTSGGTVTSKTRFAPNGGINTAGTTSRTFGAGTLTVGVVSAPVAAVPRALDDAAAPFAWAGTDKVTVSLSGDLAAFKNVTTPAANNAYVLLTATGTCLATTTNPNAGIAAGTVAAGAVTFAAVNYSALSTGSAEICLVAPTGNVVINSTDINTSVKVLRTATNAELSANGAASSIKYNGPVVEVDHFNPASNSSQISYLRIINPSSAPGLVSISGVCDNGDVQAPVSLTLAAGNAVLLTAADMAAGNKGLSSSFAQCSAGKSRLTVTGEFNGMKVQNFLRNVTADGGQINTNVNNQD